MWYFGWVVWGVGGCGSWRWWWGGVGGRGGGGGGGGGAGGGGVGGGGGGGEREGGGGGVERRIQPSGPLEVPSPLDFLSTLEEEQSVPD